MFQSKKAPYWELILHISGIGYRVQKNQKLNPILRNAVRLRV